MLDNREWAAVIWLGIASLWALSRKDLRSSIADVLGAALNPYILLPLGAMIGHVALEVLLGSKLSLWRSDLAKGTLIWLLVSGLVMLFSFDKASKEPHFFRRGVIAVFGVSAFLECFMNFFVLSLIGELLLQPVLFVLAGISMVASRNDRYHSVKRLADSLLALIGFSLFAFTAQQFYSNWCRIDKHTLLLQLALPIWLAIGFLPFIYLLSLYADYESAFRRIDRETADWRVRLRTKLALVTKLHFGTRDTHAFTQPWSKQITSASSFAAARQVVAEFQKSRRDAERALIEEQEQLRRYVGSNEADAEGRRLDRREFKETMNALRWLATCQMGRYRNQGGRYQADLLKRLNNDFTQQGLPPDSGISMKVAEDGQAWYAWRRTVTGWCFAIGVAGPAPDQWEYDGPDPPRGFPGKDRRWGQRAFSDEVNRNWIS